MILRALVGTNGPIWVKVVDSCISKAVVGSTLTIIHKRSKVKEIHDQYMQNKLRSIGHDTN